MRRIDNLEHHLPLIMLFVLVTANLIGAGFTYQDFGLTWDEPLFYQYGDAVGYAYSITARFEPDFDLERAYGPSATDHKIYGPAYLLIGGAVRWALGLILPEELWSLWRLVNFIFFQAGLIALYFFSRRWIGSWAALASTLLMAYQPLLWGMAFINPKDMPFLIFFIFVLASGMRWVDRVCDHDGIGRISTVSRSKSDVFAAWRIIWIVAIIVAIFCLFALIWLYSDKNDATVVWLVSRAYHAPPDSILAKLFLLVAPNAHGTPLTAYINKSLTLFYNLKPGAGFGLSVLLFLCLGLVALRYFPGFLIRFDQWLTSRFRWPGIHLQAEQRNLRQARVWFQMTVLPAVLIGCLTSIRIIGPLAGLFILGYFLLRLENRTWWPMMIYVMIALVTLWVTWPYLWDSPLLKFIEVLRHMANNPQILPVLFNYVVYPSNQLPGEYLPMMMWFTLTEPIWLFFFVGLGLAVWQMMKGSLDWRSFIWITAWLLVPLVYVLWRKPPMYDGFRHFLFLLPPVFIISGLAFKELFRFINLQWVRSLLILGAILPGILGIVQTHPYEYAYYNSAAGGLAGAFRRFETDYWLTCYKELVPQLEQHNPSSEGMRKLLVHRQPANARYYLPEGFEVVRYEPDDPQVESGDYLLLTTRSNVDLAHQPAAPVVLKVEKNGAELCVIKQIP
jgi:hypothetical protein